MALAYWPEGYWDLNYLPDTYWQTLGDGNWLKLDDVRNWKGNWSAYVTYSEGDIVLYQVGDYWHAFTSKASHNFGNPPTDAAYWERVAQDPWLRGGDA